MNEQNIKWTLAQTTIDHCPMISMMPLNDKIHITTF